MLRRNTLAKEQWAGIEPCMSKKRLETLPANGSDRFVCFPTFLLLGASPFGVAHLAALPMPIAANSIVWLPLDSHRHL